MCSCSIFLILFSQGIRFLHERNVAHRYNSYNRLWRFKSDLFGSDCTANNIKVTATRRSPRYYFIGFGLSRQYPSRDAMDEPLPGGDESAPEHRSSRVCNPFHTDIYYIGNLVRKEFMEVCDRVAGYIHNPNLIFVRRSVMVSNSWRIWSPL